MIALGLFAAFAARAAVVYKWTDANGVVHFSDQPEPGAEKVITSSGDATANAATTPAAAAAAAQAAPKPATPKPPKPTVALPYTLIAITSPSAQHTFFNESIGVHLALEPDLQEGQTITWYLNGAALTNQAPDAEQFVLQDIGRGTYTISATVTDPATGQTMSAAPVTFYVQQPSLLSPQHHNNN
jgi:membrane carboxypeptidase/penicillin-binding protein PbpC